MSPVSGSLMISALSLARTSTVKLDLVVALQPPWDRPPLLPASQGRVIDGFAPFGRASPSERV